MTKPTDIRGRETQQDYWSTFEKIWTSLLTYRYLGRPNPVLDQGVEDIVMPLRYDMRNADGGVMAAPLAIAAAECGGMQDDLYIPNPIESSLQIIDPGIGVQRIKVIPETIKLGKTMGFSRSRIVDASDESRVLALSSGSAISLGSPPPGFKKVYNPSIAIVDSPQLPPLTEVFGARELGGGVWELPALGANSASPDAALHLGPQHVALEAAATELAKDIAGGSSLQIIHWQVVFVARGKVGPFQTRGRAFLGRTNQIAIELTLIDCGNNNRPITSASAMYSA